MTGTNHGMTGAVIAILLKEPVLALPLSFASHFVCDAIPHASLNKGVKSFDRTFNLTLAADFIIAFSLMALLCTLFHRERWLIWGCMIAAASPDLMWAYYDLYLGKLKSKIPKLDPLARFHTWIQWSQTPKGWIVEAVWFCLMGRIILGQL
jgi:hypothetical protein